jgi:hypothetical protein
MRVKRHAAQVLILCFSSALPTFAQLDSAALRVKFGAPLNRETFQMAAGFDLIVDYGVNGQACKLLVPALMPTTEPVSNATVMKQRMYDFLATLVPDSIRGRELRRGVLAMGAITMTVIEYENVRVNEMDVGEPFHHDNTITIAFKRDDCKDAVGRQA